MRRIAGVDMARHVPTRAENVREGSTPGGVVEGVWWWRCPRVG